ncbi:MAG TPA: hypothetical protein PKY91_14115, partial [Rhodocyclaceae bacterium]|nr:hypothetical protein [Rhodocyclaceae bacterium]
MPDAGVGKFDNLGWGCRQNFFNRLINITDLFLAYFMLITLAVSITPQQEMDMNKRFSGLKMLAA